MCTGGAPTIQNRFQPVQRLLRSRQRCIGSHQQLRIMASTVLNKPYRFILVSDLDWTMVSAAAHSRSCCCTSSHLLMADKQKHCHVHDGHQCMCFPGRSQRQRQLLIACFQQALGESLCQGLLVGVLHRAIPEAIQRTQSMYSVARTCDRTHSMQ